MKYFIATMTLVALIGVALPVFAEDDDRDDDRKTTPVALTADQTVCIKTALTKREAALIAGHDTYSAGIKTAYQARSTALIAAWDKATTNERRTAVKAADRAFHDTTKTVRKTWNTARRTAWKTFETERKACVPKEGSQISASDTGSAKVDASL